MMKMEKYFCLGLSLLLCGFFTAGCQSVYYSAWETLGKQKRDLLKAKVLQARDQQKETNEKLTDALTRLKEVYGFKGGDLEKVYRGLQADYERSAAKADGVRKRIREMDQIANDLFREWEGEAKTITSESLRASSQSQLRDTRRRYDDLRAALLRAEKAMDPVLVRFHDYVLFLKHSLNAQAIGALQGETSKIQAEIGRLIEEMNSSIAQADQFIKSMP